MNDTANKNETTVRTEWGYEITWQDGHIEYKREGSRQDADFEVWNINRNSPNANANKTARLVTRTVTATPWAQV